MSAQTNEMKGKIGPILIVLLVFVVVSSLITGFSKHAEQRGNKKDKRIFNQQWKTLEVAPLTEKVKFCGSYLTWKQRVKDNVERLDSVCQEISIQFLTTQFKEGKVQ